MPETHSQAYKQFQQIREQRGLSISEIANALHLNVSVIEQIEAGDFSHRRFAPVFMRGYIRSYAKYLNLPDNLVNLVIAMLDAENQAEMIKPQLQSIVKKTPLTPRIRKIAAYISVVFLLIICSSMWHNRSKTIEEKVIEPAIINSVTDSSIDAPQLATPDLAPTSQEVVPEQEITVSNQAPSSETETGIETDTISATADNSSSVTTPTTPVAPEPKPKEIQNSIASTETTTSTPELENKKPTGPMVIDAEETP